MQMLQLLQELMFCYAKFIRDIIKCYCLHSNRHNTPPLQIVGCLYNFIIRFAYMLWLHELRARLVITVQPLPTILPLPLVQTERPSATILQPNVIIVIIIHLIYDLLSRKSTLWFFVRIRIFQVQGRYSQNLEWLPVRYVHRVKVEVSG